jgi:hypothetical protein
VHFLVTQMAEGDAEAAEEDAARTR